MREAIVLAGGKGTRLRSAVPDLPKPMARVAGKPFLEHLLSQLWTSGVHRTVISVGYKSEDIISYFGQRYEGMEIAYAVEDEPLGTGGAIKESMKKCRGDGVLVLNGDSYCSVDLASVDELWSRTRDPIMVLCEVEDTSRFGRVRVEQERVVGFEEKGKQGRGWINAGIYVLPKSVLEGYPDGAAFSLETDFFLSHLEKISLRAVRAADMFIDIGIPDDYYRAQQLFLGK